MRRSIATLLLPLAALTACATTGGIGGGSTPYTYSGSGASYGAEPLHVRLTENGGEGLFLHLNRPAYTAVFQIIPGHGVALLYPNFGERQMYSPGMTRLMPSLASNRFWRYDNVRHNPFAFASGISQGPRHLLVVASERPLETSRFRGGTLRQVLGTSSYTTMSARRVVDDLLAVVVPPQPDESWDADVITVWPAVNDVRLPSGDLYRVRCRDGTSLWVPLELAAAACRNPDRVLPRDSTLGQPPRGDSTGVRKPGGRRPQPEPGAGDGEGPARPGTRLSQLRDEMRSYRNSGGEAGAREIRITDLRRDLDVLRSGGEGNVIARWRNAREGDSPMSTERIVRPGMGSTGRPASEPSSPATHAYTASPAASAAGGVTSERPTGSEGAGTTRPETQPAPPP